MRESEICDLKVTDIVERNGIDVIVVREGKTDAADRIIPVHPELKKIGFLRYVQAMRDAGHAMLFPDLPVGRGRSRGQLFSKWFSRFVARAKVKTDKSKNFHSFRHTFRDALGEAVVSRDALRQLGAWAGVDTADKNYGAGLRASTLAREIEKVGYPGLDLSHLYLEGSKPPPTTNDDGDAAVP
jgi:integrase